MLTIYIVAKWGGKDGKPQRRRGSVLAFTNKREAKKAARKCAGVVVKMLGAMPPRPTMLDLARKRMSRRLAKVEKVLAQKNSWFADVKWLPAKEGDQC